MSFQSTLEIKNEAAIIKLIGELDAASAPQFKAEVDKASAEKVKHLVLNMKELAFMSSAGLRVLVFSKQKMGENVDIYVESADEMIVDTLEKTGLIHSVIIVDEYPG